MPYPIARFIHSPGNTLMPTFYNGEAKMDLGHLQENSRGLELSDNAARIDIDYYDCCGNIAYPSMTFSIKITKNRRDGLYEYLGA